MQVNSQLDRHLQTQIQYKMLEELTSVNEHLREEIERRKKTEKELILSKDKADEANRAKSDFIANMSHEIRTPLNIILGYSQMLLKKEGNENNIAQLNAIKSSSETLMHIMNQILEQSKLDSGTVELNKEVVNLRPYLEELKRSFEIQATSKNLYFSLKIDPTVPNAILADKTRLTQVLLNLLGNAVKFTTEGKVEINVSSTYQNEQQAGITFQIKDTGIGIPQDKQKIIFDRFKQERNDTSRVFGGSGLGLSIAKRIVELHGGKLTLVSEKNIGTSVTVSLELEKVEIKESKTSKKPVKFDYSKAHLLIVEDNVWNQEMAKMILNDMGCKVTVVGSGKECIEKMAYDKYCAVLLDLHMPEMDGFETSQIIRQNDSDTPIVALTADISDNTKQKIKKSGIDNLLYKPIIIDELTTVLNIICEKRNG